MPQPKPINPFYALLLPVGVAFAITACAYGVMTVTLLDPRAAPPETGLVAWLSRHGVLLLTGELGALAVLTFAAIGTDEFWTARARRAQEPDQSP